MDWFKKKKHGNDEKVLKGGEKENEFVYDPNSEDLNEPITDRDNESNTIGVEEDRKERKGTDKY